MLVGMYYSLLRLFVGVSREYMAYNLNLKNWSFSLKGNLRAQFHAGVSIPPKTLH